MALAQSLHASAFAYQGAGCLLLGASGAGKSRILAEAILHGANMIADDQVMLHAENGVLIAAPPPTLEGVLELRGLGLITEPFIPRHPMHLVVTLSTGNGERLPEPEMQEFCGVTLPNLTLSGGPTLAVPSLLLYLKAVQEKRTLPTDWRPLG